MTYARHDAPLNSRPTARGDETATLRRELEIAREERDGARAERDRVKAAQNSERTTSDEADKEQARKDHEAARGHAPGAGFLSNVANDASDAFAQKNADAWRKKPATPTVASPTTASADMNDASDAMAERNANAWKKR